jgi:alkanesulfonate monooxygenase SsuD/methylene tetrahydromethanopterin reductase-like flavin-dependent oxidoreductase (luciferase family)
VGWTEWRNITRWTEDLGYESLWRSDHWFSFGPNRGNLDALEAMASLVHVAENTQRIRFGTLVLSMTFRHPAMVARMAAQVDALSGGRLILGIGAGWNQPEHDAFGLDLPPPGPRIRILDESAAVIRALWSGKPANFEGRYFKLRDATIRPLPAQSPMPLLIGANGEQLTLKVAAKYADDWNGGIPSLDVYRHKSEVLARHCEAVGRNPADISRSVMCGYIVGENDVDVRRQWDEMLEQAPPQMRERLQQSQRMGPIPYLPMLAGTPSQLVEQIKTLEAEGISRVMLQNRTPPRYETLAMVAKEVLPHVA